ncbi:MAG: aminotransferase class V-fold PLP-dependent enzyme [bacterium]
MKTLFPFYQHHPKAVYLDNACQTLRPQTVVDAVMDYYIRLSSCAGRSNHDLAEAVNKLVLESRQSMAKLLNGQAEEIVFVRNTTEAINMVANGFHWAKDDLVVTTGKEHNSNLLPWIRLAKQGKIRHLVADLDEQGNFSLDKFKQAVVGSRLVSFPWVSNLDGEVFPIKDMVKIVHQAGAFVLIDAAQAVGHIKIDVKDLDIDFLCLSGHKMYGPSGTGVLWGKKEMLEKLEPLSIGGGTVNDSSYDNYELLAVPERLEAGLQDYGGIIGLGASARFLAGKVEESGKQEHQLAELVREQLAGLGNITLFGPADSGKRSGIVSFTVKGKSVHEVSLLLSKAYDVYVRSGQLCVHSWFHRMGMTNGVIRASFGMYNDQQDAARLVEAIKNISKL